MKTILASLITLMLLGSGLAYAGPYTDSAHGDTDYGVTNTSHKISSPTSSYAIGNCTHCHLYQHLSLDGAPSGTALSPQARSDIIPFCLDCHYKTQNDSSASITWNDAVTIDNNDIHGDRNITDTVSLLDLGGINAGDITETDGHYSISCVACHEPHGTSNVMLIREEVNAGAVSGITSMDTADWINLCARCHSNTGDVQDIHHNDPYPKSSGCSCHPGGDKDIPIPCNNCHFHGADDSWVGSIEGETATGERPF